MVDIIHGTVVMGGTALQRRTDWSTRANLKKMKEAVEEWDRIKDTVRAPPSKAAFAKLRGIPPYTFHKYAHNDVTKRRRLGSKLGRNCTAHHVCPQERGHVNRSINRTRKTSQLVEENATDEHGSLKESEKDLLRDHLSTEKSNYRLIRRRLPQLTRTQKRKLNQGHWEQRLPQLCTMMEKDVNFLNEELRLLRQCGCTFDSAEVRYNGPRPLETCDETFHRRARMETKINKFKLVQTRRALTLLHSGACYRELFVAIDTLLEKYDRVAEGQGLERSGLREQLHTCHFNGKESVDSLLEKYNGALQAKGIDPSGIWKQLQKINHQKKQKSKSEEVIEGEFDALDLGLSETERFSLCRKVRSKMHEEECIVDEELNAASLEELGALYPKKKFDTDQDGKAMAADILF